jgi:CHAT domain-containing protein
LGPEHQKVAESLGNLGNLYRKTGAYARAEPLLRRALAIRKKALGQGHPKIARSLSDLAGLYSATGAYAKAEELYLQAQAIQAKNSERFLLTGSESRKHAYLQELAADTHRSVSFSAKVRSPGSIALGLTSVLQYKGRVLDEMSGSVARLRRSVQPANRELLDQLAQVANQFSTLTYQGLGKLSPAEYQQRLDALSQRREQLEVDLAKRSAEFRQRVTPVTLAAVRNAIPSRAILVEWFRYQPFDAKAARLEDQHAPPRYVAYVLAPNGQPSLVDIGDARVIEASVRDFLQAAQDPTHHGVEQRARSLSDKLVKPLHAHLHGVERLLISPDGMLSLVPVAALLDESDQYLVQRFEITYLTSGRDLLRMTSPSSSQHGTVIIADPDYGKPVRSLAATESRPGARRSGDLDRSGIVFRALPYTASEARAIKALLELDDSSVLTRLDATESSLKQLHGPRILHVASHGFFLNDQQLAVLDPNAQQAMRKGENPLLRAGIALAGANARRSGANDDGILTALEATQLDLHGAELVVLSACETGVGQVQNGEGVYGLRRALFIAGAQTQITSLWNVPDKATSTLMVDYYRGLLEGQGRSAALRAAQRKMLAMPRRSHPYYWASFVPIGNWAPLAMQH